MNDKYYDTLASIGFNLGNDTMRMMAAQLIADLSNAKLPPPYR